MGKHNNRARERQWDQNTFSLTMLLTKEGVVDTILLTQKAGNNAIDHSQGETGVGMWKYAVGGGIHGQGRGGAKENAYSAFL